MHFLLVLSSEAGTPSKVMVFPVFFNSEAGKPLNNSAFPAPERAAIDRKINKNRRALTFKYCSATDGKNKQLKHTYCSILFILTFLKSMKTFTLNVFLFQKITKARHAFTLKGF